MADGLEEMGLPPLGHNQPPDSTALDRVAELLANANRWAKDRPTITDADMAGACQRFIEQLRLSRDDLKAARDAELAPINLLARAVFDRYEDPIALVPIALERMQALATAWLQREKDRLAAEELERRRLADEAIVRAAQAQSEAEQPGATVEQQLAARKANDQAAQAVDHAMSVPKRAQVRDDYAPRAMSLRSNWRARVIDERAALKAYAKHPAIRAVALAEIVKVCSKLAKTVKGDAAKQPPGVEFYNDEKAV